MSLASVTVSGDAEASRYIVERVCRNSGSIAVGDHFTPVPGWCEWRTELAGWRGRDDLPIGALPPRGHVPKACGPLVRSIIRNGCQITNTTDFRDVIDDARPNSGLGFLRRYAESSPVRAPEARAIATILAQDLYRDPAVRATAFARTNDLVGRLCDEEARNHPPVYVPAYVERNVPFVRVPLSTARCWSAKARLIAENGGPPDTELAIRRWLSSSLGGLAIDTAAQTPINVFVDFGQVAVSWLQYLSTDTTEAPVNSLDELATKIDGLVACDQAFADARDNACPI